MQRSGGRITCRGVGKFLHTENQNHSCVEISHQRQGNHTKRGNTGLTDENPWLRRKENVDSDGVSHITIELENLLSRTC